VQVLPVLMVSITFLINDRAPNLRKNKIMKNKPRFLFLVLALLVGVHPAHAQGNLLVNGGFEDPVIAANSYSKLATISGWTTPNVGGLFEIWSGTFGSIPATEGIQSLEINASIADETVFQTISVTPGVLTTLSFDYTGREPDNTFTISLSGGYAFSTTLDPASYYTTPAWTTFTETFVPTTSTLTVTFRGQPVPALDAGAHIDNVSVVQTVPEPSTLALAGLGGLGMLWQLRRRKKADQPF